VSRESVHHFERFCVFVTNLQVFWRECQGICTSRILQEPVVVDISFQTGETMSCFDWVKISKMHLSIWHSLEL